ncbi:MAG: RNA polymerase sigma factor [Planctomycetaceae bacterium]
MVQVSSDLSASDGELVRMARSGQTDAYAELVRRWSTCVLAVCHARVRCGSTAEDLAQETLLRGFRDLGSLTSPDKFGPWLRAIAHRVCLDWLKSKQTKQRSFTELSADGRAENFVSAGNDTAATVILADELERLMHEVQSLSDSLCEVLMLFYYQEMTYRDIADLLGISTATVNARLTRARAALRERLSQSPR